MCSPIDQSERVYMLDAWLHLVEHPAMHQLLGLMITIGRCEERRISHGIACHSI